MSFTMNNEGQQEDYLKNRLEDQINWYDRKSSKYQKMYKGLQLASIVIAALIPLFTGYLSDYPDLKYLVGILGVLVGVFTAMNSLYKYQENWIAYRSTSESLIHEKYLFITNSKPYQGKDSFNLLVQRVEMLISQENSSWAEMSKTAVESKE